MRPEALEALRGVDHILHAGDIGGEHVLEALREIAPLTFVAGNNDDPGSAGPRRFKLPVTIGIIEPERAYHVDLR